MDFLRSIHAGIEENFLSKELIPQKFASPQALLHALDSFKNYLNKNQKCINKNLRGKYTDFIIDEILKIKREIIEAIDYAKVIFDYDDAIIPYQQLRYDLVKGNIQGFIGILQSLLASVPYSISKVQEGFFHSNIHVILKLLGFEILSEEEKNNGRIDAVIRFSDKLFILEFKFCKSKDISDTALRQIKEKEYALKLKLENKEIFAVGISFSETKRNINGFKFEKLK